MREGEGGVRYRDRVKVTATVPDSSSDIRGAPMRFIQQCLLCLSRLLFLTCYGLQPQLQLLLFLAILAIIQARMLHRRLGIHVA
jgi:hypothetical protein